MRAFANDKFNRENTYSFSDAQVVGSVRFSFASGLLCGIIVAVAAVQFFC